MKIIKVFAFKPMDKKDIQLYQDGGRLTEKAIQILEEFRTFEVENIQLIHILYIKESAKEWSGKLSYQDNQKLMDVCEYLMINK